MSKNKRRFCAACGLFVLLAAGTPAQKAKDSLGDLWMVVNQLVVWQKNTNKLMDTQVDILLDQEKLIEDQGHELQSLEKRIAELELKASVPVVPQHSQKAMSGF